VEVPTPITKSVLSSAADRPEESEVVATLPLVTRSLAYGLGGGVRQPVAVARLHYVYPAGNHGWKRIRRQSVVSASSGTCLIRIHVMVRREKRMA